MDTNMMAVGLGHYLVVSAILLVLGIFGIFLNRKNIIVILMSVELILLAVNLNFVAFSAALGDLVGQIFAMFVLTVAAAEAVPRHVSEHFCGRDRLLRQRPKLLDRVFDSIVLRRRQHAHPRRAVVALDTRFIQRGQVGPE